jgi:Leucine-rich repeat (LRR) protein
LEALSNLRKLYIERNCIARLEGLHNCKRLQELYLSKQKLPDFVEFTFDEEFTLPAIAVSISL